MTPVRQIIKAGGGHHKLARKLGYPCNIFMLRLWERCDEIPEEWREAVAEATGISEADMIPPDDVSVKPRRYRAIAHVYGIVYRRLGLNVGQASALHGVSRGTVEDWLTGRQEPTAQAFIDMHYMASGRRKKAEKLTIDQACKALNLSQAKLCEKLGVTRTMATKWKKSGMPEMHARRVVEWMREAK